MRSRMATECQHHWLWQNPCWDHRLAVALGARSTGVFVSWYLLHHIHNMRFYKVKSWIECNGKSIFSRYLSLCPLDITKLRWLKHRDASSATCCSREFSAATACPLLFSLRLTFCHVQVSELESAFAWGKALKFIIHCFNLWLFVSASVTVRSSSKQIASRESSTKAWKAFKDLSTHHQSLRLLYPAVSCCLCQGFRSINLISLPRIFHRDCSYPAGRIDCMADLWSSGCSRGLSFASPGCADLQRLRTQPHDFTHSHYLPCSALHNLRFQDQKDSGEFQWSEVYWLYNVLNMHSVPCFYRDLLRHEQRLQNSIVEPVYVPGYQCDCGSGVFVLAESLSRSVPAVQERKAEKQWRSRCAARSERQQRWRSWSEWLWYGEFHVGVNLLKRNCPTLCYFCLICVEFGLIVLNFIPKFISDWCVKREKCKAEIN